MTQLKNTFVARNLPNPTNIRELIRLDLNNDDQVKVIAVNNKLHIVCLYGESDINNFELPIINKTNLRTYVYVDLRGVSYSTKSGKVYPEVIADKPKAEILITAAILTGLWETDVITEWGFTYRPPFTLLINVVSDSITRGFHVSDQDAALIRILVTTMFVDILNPTAKDNIRSKNILELTNASSYDMEQLEEILSLARILNISMLVKAIKASCTSATLKVLEPQHIFAGATRPFSNLVSPTYIGVALEYPAFWIALVDVVHRAGGFRFKAFNKQLKHIDDKIKSMSKAVERLWEEAVEDRLI